MIIPVVIDIQMIVFFFTKNDSGLEEMMLVDK